MIQQRTEEGFPDGQRIHTKTLILSIKTRRQVSDTIFTSLQEQCSACDSSTEFPCELRRGVRALFCIGSTKPTRKGKEVSSAIHRRAARLPPSSSWSVGGGGGGIPLSIRCSLGLPALVISHLTSMRSFYLGDILLSIYKLQLLYSNEKHDKTLVKHTLHPGFGRRI